MLDDTALLDVVGQKHPLRREVVRPEIICGASVAEIVRAMDLDTERFGLPVVRLIRGTEISVVPIAMWCKVRPKPGTRVEAAFPVRDPGSLALLVSAALPSAATWAAGALGFAAGTVAYSLTVAAITVVGSLAINSLIPPAQQSGSRDPENYAITGAGNAVNRYGVYPYVIGRHRMFPPMTATGFSETVSRDIYYRGRMTFGWCGPAGLMLEDLRIGNTPIWEYDGVELEFRNVDEARTLAKLPELADLVKPRTEEDQAPKKLLSSVGDLYEFQPAQAAKSVVIEVEPTAMLEGTVYSFVVEVAEVGVAGWTTAATYTDIDADQTFQAGPFSDGTARRWRIRITDKRQLYEGETSGYSFMRPESEGVTVTRASATYQAPAAGWRMGSEIMRLYSDDVAEDAYSDVPQHQDPIIKYTRQETVVAAIDLTFPQGLYNSTFDGDRSSHRARFVFEYQSTQGGINEADWVSVGETEWSGKFYSLYRVTQEISFPAPDEYAIRITRTNGIDDAVGDFNSATLTAIRSFRDGKLPSHAGIAEVAFRIKANEQLNGRIDSLNAIVQQLAPELDDNLQWTEPRPVRHPAWLYAEALRGSHLRRPVADERIDLAALYAWAAEEPHWTCDYVVDTATQLADVLDIICAAGRGRRTLADLRYSVVRDGAAGPVRQVFTPRNSWDYRSKLTFPREIHGFRCMVRSERLDWQEDEVLVLKDGYTRQTATELETLQLPGTVVTSEDEDEGNTYRLGRYHLATALHRPEAHSFKADWESIHIQQGDKIRLVHDVPLIGVGEARVKALTVENDLVTSITLDDVFDFEQASFRMVVRNVTAGIHAFAATSPVNPQARIWTPDVGLIAGDIAVGDLVAIEETEQRSADMLVMAVRPEQDETAVIEVVDAAPHVLDAATSEIPLYNPVITNPRPSTLDLPPAPVITMARSSQLTQIVMPDLSVRPRIAAQLAPIASRADLEGVTVQLRWREAEEDQTPWTYGEAVPAGEYSLLTGALEEGASYLVEARTVGRMGKTRGWFAAPAQITATTDAPAPPTIVASAVPGSIPDANGSARRPAIRLSWEVPTNRTFRVTWQLRVAATGEVVQRGLFAEASEGVVVISDGILPATAYQIQASFVSGAADLRSWGGWLDVATHNIRLTVDDLDEAALHGGFAQPGIPANLTLSTELRGDGTALVKALWDVVDPATGYEVEVAEDGGNYVGTSATTNTYVLAVLPAVDVQVRVRAVNGSRRSGWTGPETITAAIDTVAPATPTGLTGTISFDSAWLSWDDNAEFDLSHYEVFRRRNDAYPPYNPIVYIYRATSSNFLWPDLEEETEYWFWVRAVDTSGNKSAWAGPYNDTTIPEPGVSREDLQGIIDETSFASGLEPIKVVDELPPAVPVTNRVVFLTTDSKLYRNDGSGWTPQVSSSDLTGQLTSAQIASIEAAKIAGQLASSQIQSVEASKVTGQLSNSQLEDIQAAKIAGQLTSAQIESIVAGKVTGTLADGQIASVNASKLTGTIAEARLASIAASKVTGQLTNAQIASLAAAKLTGTIGSAQIADAAINTAKFASGLRPIEIVSSLPAAPHIEGRLVYLTTDNKMYRNTGSEWTASIAAGDISGTLAAAQIEAVEASKITGQLTNSQLAEIAAAKVTGQLTNSQIGTVSSTKITGQLSNAQLSAIDAAKVTGQLVSSQIADASISTAKFAAGLHPVEVVSVLPGTPHIAGRTVFLTTDDKMYRNTGSGWTASVSAVDLSGQVQNSQIGSISSGKITGQLTNTQLENIEAAKIIGQLANAQIGSVSSGKITGQLTDSQLADIAAAKITGQITGVQITDNAVTATKINAGAVTTAKLAAGAVTADQIGANAITAAKIEAGAVTTAKIDAAAVTANEIATGSITAGKIQAGAVTTGKLAAGAVVADKIGANAVTANKIAAGAVEADKIAANAITAGKIAAGAVTATELAAGSIVASKLAVIDTTNVVPDNQMIDPSVWDLNNGFVIQPSVSDFESTVNLLNSPASGSGAAPNDFYSSGWTKQFPMEAGRPFKYAATMRRAGTGHLGKAQVRVYFYNADGETLAGVEFGEIDFSTALEQIFSRIITAPIDTVAAAMQCRRQYDANGDIAGEVRFYNLSARPAADASLIVDGAVVADKIATNAVTATKIDAEAVTADKIATSAVTAEKINAGAVTAAKIDAGAVSTAKLAAGAVIADKIGANAITAAKIEAGAVSTAKLATGAVDAGKIAAGAVTADKIASNAITTDKLDANAITSGKIAAGAVTADQIAAKAITASKLAIIDTSNLMPDNRLLDPAVWTLNTGFSIQPSTSSFENATNLLASTASGSGAADGFYSSAWCRSFPVETGRPYRFFGTMRKAGTGHLGEAQLRAYFRDEAGNTIQIVEFGNLDFGTALEQKFFEILTAPAGAVAAEIQCRRQYNSAGDINGEVRFYNLGAQPAVDASLLVDGSILAQHISASAIESDKIAASAITAGKIATGAVTATKIEAGAITTAKLAAGAVTAESITGGTITGDKLVAGTIGTDQLAANAITSGKIAAGAVLADKLGANSVTAVKIDAGAVTTGKLAAEAVVADKIAAGAITTPKLDAGAVNASKIAAGAITTDKLDVNAVTSGKIAAGAVQAGNIEAGAVTTGKLAASAVIADKIASNAVTTDKISTAAVVADKIASNAITTDKLAANAITAGKVAAGAIGADQIAAQAIVASKIAVTDATNLMPDNVLVDPASWQMYDGFSIQPSTSSLEITANVIASVAPYSTGDAGAYYSQARSLMFPVETGRPYKVFGSMRKSGSGHYGEAQLRVTFYDVNDAVLQTVQFGLLDFGTALEQKFSQIVTAPPEAVRANIRCRRERDGSGQIGGEVRFYKLGAQPASDGSLIVDGTIQANHLSAGEVVTSGAQIRDAIITNAKIADLSAAKLTAGTALASTLTVAGTALSTINDRAFDPAARINSVGTQITPGKILISGSTTLADWRRGGDSTKIDGGAISANTVSANKLEIGSRNITLTGITFEHNAPGADQVSWTSGRVRYVNDAGSITSVGVDAGSATWTSGVIYIYWPKDGTALATTNTQSVALAANNVPLATYEGGTQLDTNLGRTIIDGDSIKTGSITVGKLAADVLSADNIETGVMNARHIEVTDTLKLDATTAGFSVGKASAGDLTNPGIYLGRTSTGGADGFGLVAGGVNAAGQPEYIEVSKSRGTRLVNAKHYRDLAVRGTTITLTSSNLIVLDPFCKYVEVVMVSGGNGGNGGREGGHAPSIGGRGTQTSVTLYSGGTSTGDVRLAPLPDPQREDDRSSRNGGDGMNSALGVGGRGGKSGAETGRNATGYGAGGGGGYSIVEDAGHGGYAAPVVTEIIDVSTTANARLLVGIGAAGAKGLGEAGVGYDGGNGSPGYCRITQYLGTPVRADVLPIAPTAFGTFPSDGPFPDLGAGFWTITTTDWAEAHIRIGEIEVDDSGTPLNARFGGSMSFYSSKTPVIVTTDRDDKTNVYHFRKLGD